MVIDIQRYWGEREIYFPGELSSKIIQSMQTDGHVTLRSKEARGAEISGLYALLDQLCNYWKWDHKNITIETGNVYDLYFKESKYTLKPMIYAEPLVTDKLASINHRPWNREKTYGMFIGRANVTRLHAIHRHKTFEYRDQGLTSFNHDLSNHIESHYLIEYLTQTDKKISEVLNIKPYSDIGNVQTPPITTQFGGLAWDDVYEKIAIEIVLETAEDEGVWSLTEKIVRPMLYKRPFILIAAPNVIKDVWKQFHTIFKGTEFESMEPPGTQRFFENVIPLEYDSYGGIHRVDCAFDILHTLIRTGKINTILEDCHDDIENNYQRVTASIKLAQKHRNEYNQMFDRESWGRPTYE